MAHEKPYKKELNITGMRSILLGTVLDSEQGKLTANIGGAVGKKNIIARENNYALDHQDKFNNTCKAKINGGK